ncbi:SusC/RagA family TonB-linked outer membrane protein [uncultured Duncaniella sp.]|uniref:SusC/RagA family TonB-linked outer membrane protein n=1 Tax=uncultured Duncaniella sp. TaxID=2768039 RepID=UPI00259D2FF3|nr:SusC/RagA family TonB-linked outer membrane protein [uncultured Duncaniella sp.]
MYKPILYLLTGTMAMTLPVGVSAQAGKDNVRTSMEKIEKKTISGTIFDEDGDPLPGATVLVEDSKEGTSTDVDGNFTLMSGKKNPTLVISYVGMKTARIKVDNGGRYIRIRMQPAPNMMNEVVVTGYQNIKRESATGSYQVLTSDDLDKRSTTDLASRLEGTVPGLVMDPKKNSTDEDAFTIRGVGTFQAKSSPLIVVDGLPIEGGISTVNPYDIENITVLKDAAAASIYGARASNGVIVITTKRASQQRMTIDFNTDLTISEKQDYSNYGWASAAEMIELERYNFNAMLAEPGQAGLNSVMTDYDNNRRGNISKVMRMLLQNRKCELSDADLNATLSDWARNDYRKEYIDVHDRTQVTQLYNLSMRMQGNSLSSSFNVNYSSDNMGVRNENQNSLSFKYRGDLKACKWLDLSFGVNVLNTRSKTHSLGEYGSINSFLPYESMYDADGTRRGMEAAIYTGHNAFDTPVYELKNPTFNLADEMDRNFSKRRYTNTRTFIHANFNILPGWTASGQFQYEDIFARTCTVHEADSYMMRNIYNLYTTASSVMEWVDDTSKDWWGADMDFDAWMADPEHYGMTQVAKTEAKHHVPDGGSLETYTQEAKYYTFRAQTGYRNTFAGKHFIDAVAGMEYRQTKTTSESSVMLGYDEATQTNLNLNTDWDYINNPTTNVFGADNPVYGAPSTFKTTNILHRYYSLYVTGSYVYDNRYSVSASYRVDKTDLFGADPKFRGRPLWSVGGSWNAHNETFLRDYNWLNALKLRASYGLTGNIDPNSTSYLTATISTNSITGGKQGNLQTPPNDQLRWEKTATWNAGIDFAFLGYRLNGSLDYYHKSGSDLLTITDLDRTTGWSSLTINSGNMINRGVELQLDGVILPSHGRRSLGIRLGFNFAYNHNEVTSVSHHVNSGVEYLSSALLHEGYPINSLFSFDYTGLKEVDGLWYMGWRDHNGEEHTTSISNSEFTIDDVIYSGPATPKFTGAITPTITWNGFSLSAMFNYYGGHYMRVGNDEWSESAGGGYGYGNTFGNGAVSSSALRYWHGDTSYPANGYFQKDYKYLNYASYRNTNVVHADYLKFRNVMLSYNFDPKLCRKIGLNDIRLRFQVNNLGTWARNSRNIDPEAISGGRHIDKVPRSYTFSLFFNL